jgi:hypothetical protein
MNREKSSILPSEYIPLFVNRLGGDENKLREILKNHLINDEAYEAVLADDFEKFITARKQSVVDAISKKVPQAAISKETEDA